MTTQEISSQANPQNTNPGNIGRSIAAVLAGFVVVAALSLITDEIFHLLKVYPP